MCIKHFKYNKILVFYSKNSERKNLLLINIIVNTVGQQINNLEKTDPSEIERTYNIRKQQTRFLLSLFMRTNSTT